MPTDPPPDLSENDAPRPSRRLPILGLTLRLAAASAVIAGLSLYARDTLRTAPPVRSEISAPGLSAPGLSAPGLSAPSLADAFAAQAFVPSMARPARPALAIVPDSARLRLDASDALEPVRAEPPRINPGTGLREEALSRGDFQAIEASALRLTLTRNLGPEPAPGLFVTMARRAADGPALAVIRTGPRGRIATKFGLVETLEATLSGEGRRVCTGFATLEAAPVRIDGWLCAPLGQPPEPQAIACALDALDLDDPSDPATAAVFREATTRRDPGCAAKPTGKSAELSEPAGRTGSIAAKRAARAKK